MGRTATVAGVAASLAAAAGACFAYGVLIERHVFTIRRYTVPVLPEGSPNVRVLHIADIHLMARQRRKQRFLSTLQGLEPDFVVNTGDNISQAEAIAPLVRSLGRLLDVPGVFVFGSNDYAAPRLRNPLTYFSEPTKKASGRHQPLPTQQLRSSFTDAGWVDLNNARTVMTINGVGLDLRGTDDPHHALDDLSVLDAPTDPGASLKIAVTHAPYLRVLDAFVSSGAGLILAGHTHGGQVCLPGGRALVTNCDLDPARARGLSVHRNHGDLSYLHVSGGLGSSPFAPYRFACRPEASLLTLTAVNPA